MVSPRMAMSALLRTRASLRPASALPLQCRSLATVSSSPVPSPRSSTFSDQDRIFTNIYMRHDHGIEGAKVSLDLWLCRPGEYWAANDWLK